MISVKAIYFLNIFMVSIWCQQRHKDKDDAYVDLIPLNLIPEGCDSNSYYGYGIVNGNLEKCDQYSEGETNVQYEEIKCRTMRVHANMVNEKCVCKTAWKGPICYGYTGCPSGYALYNNIRKFGRPLNCWRRPLSFIYLMVIVCFFLMPKMHLDAVRLFGIRTERRTGCTPNPCQHNGTLAIGSKQIECKCHAPWDGKFCERLACWRMAPKEHERRWRNAGDRCRCANEYAGDNCDVVLSCRNDGELIDGRCECKEPFYGEICEKKCPPGQTCGSSGLTISFIFALGVCFIMFYR